MKQHLYLVRLVRYLVVVLSFLVSVINDPFGTSVVYAQRVQGTPVDVFERADGKRSQAEWDWMRLHDPATGRIPLRIREKELAFALTLPTAESIHLQKQRSERGVSQINPIVWSKRGPYNVGGRTRALAVDISDERVMLAGGVSGGVWRSTNAGLTWTKMTIPSDLQSTSCIVQDTRIGKTNIWYYGTGELIGNSAQGPGALYAGDGIFKSTNGGISWTRLPSTVSGNVQWDHPFDFIWNIATDPSNNSEDEVYAATFGGIYRSSDGGNSWVRVLGGFSNTASRYTDVAVTSTGVVYATLSERTNDLSMSSSSRGIWRSKDGITWTDITPLGWPTMYARVVIGIAPSNENIVYFLSETPGAGRRGVYVTTEEWHSIWKYIYVSGDGSGSGGTWEDRSANLPGFGPPFGDFVSQTSYDLVVKVKPDDADVVFIGGTNLYRSSNGFATMSNTTWIGGFSTLNNVSFYASHHPDQHSLVFLPSDPSVLLSGHDGGISVTTDDLAPNIVWESLNNGYLTTQFYTVAVDHATLGDNTIIGGLQDNGSWFTNSVSSTEPWTKIGGGDGTFCAVADHRTSYYVSSQNGYIVRELIDDSGVITNGTRVDPTGATGYLFITPYVLDPNNTDRMYLAAGNVLWRNNDLTAIPLGSLQTTTVNWDLLSRSAVPLDLITAIGISKTPANRLSYGTYLGEVYRLDNAQTGDPFPVNITGVNFPPFAYISCIAVDPTDADKAIAVFTNYGVLSLFSTTDGGSSWIEVAGNLEEYPDGTGNGPSCRWVEIVPVGSSTVYFVGTSTGLYSTTSLNGRSTVWVREGAETIGNVVIDAFDTRVSDGLVVIGTHGNGVYSGTVSSDSASGIVLLYDSGSPTGGIYGALPNSGLVLANRLTAPSTNVEIDKLSYYYLGDHSSGNGSFTPVIYLSSIAQAGVPALSPFYIGNSVVPASNGWIDIDVSSENLLLVGSSSPEFFVGLKYNGTTEPIIGYTNSSNGRAWEYNPTIAEWSSLDALGLPAMLFIRATVTQLTGIETVGVETPQEFFLQQNYPNPFNASTSIEFQLPIEGFVSLIVYDIFGRNIAILLDRKKMNAGIQKVTFIADHIVSGVYFYRIQVTSNNDVNRYYDQVKKMLLIK
ncbi:MAG: T9SS type A sorting domain-containing protein [Ignavibacteriae bacterium]|nr:T9SS type A sorting domain-containing protein [Ignavibacteriota bacterium]